MFKEYWNSSVINWSHPLFRATNPVENNVPIRLLVYSAVVRGKYACLVAMIFSIVCQKNYLSGELQINIILHLKLLMDVVILISCWICRPAMNDNNWQMHLRWNLQAQWASNTPREVCISVTWRGLLWWQSCDDVGTNTIISTYLQRGQQKTKHSRRYNKSGHENCSKNRFANVAHIPRFIASTEQHGSSTFCINQSNPK